LKAGWLPVHVLSESTCVQKDTVQHTATHSAEHTVRSAMAGVAVRARRESCGVGDGVGDGVWVAVWAAHQVEQDRGNFTREKDELIVVLAVCGVARLPCEQRPRRRHQRALHATAAGRLFVGREGAV
jgi:hypothetical protein